MINQDIILKIAKEKGLIKTGDIAGRFDVSRQYANSLIKALVNQSKLIKIGSTINAAYALPEFAFKHPNIFPFRIFKHLKNKGLEEHKVFEEIEKQFPPILKLDENIRSIFIYSFSEMLNNAIEHSQSDFIDIEVWIKNKELHFIVNDHGIGVFRNVMHSRKLKSELEAIQDLLKGKLTTQPKSHSGEGIFFTSKTADIFVLESFNQKLTIDNKINDVFVGKTKRSKKGTKVSFSILINSARHLSDVFKKYTRESIDEVPVFDTTMIKIKLYTVGGVFVSRSQARRVLSGLEKFKHIIFDFDKVLMVGQAFTDEVFRVFQNKHPRKKLEAINMEDSVKFMINRARGAKE
jgi:anti-sigma regulatory factor (Ser/Thr protein kinase)